ncbi:MAG: DUF6351 family protein [Pseudomonadota bacterium]
MAELSFNAQIHQHKSYRIRAAVLATIFIGLTACSEEVAPTAPSPSAAAPASVAISILSSPGAEWVSGGDAMVRVSTTDVPDNAQIQLLLNGTDVTSQLVKDSAGGTMTGVVSGMATGNNTLTAAVTTHSAQLLTTASLDVTNSPATGPMFSGPHETPFVCQTDAFDLADGSTLGAPLDANCSVATRVDYVYRSTDASITDLQPLSSLTALPADVASTTTIDNKTVPYVVRIETGTLNRAIYQTAMLHNPAAEEAPSLSNPPDGWNGRLVYTFGGGCTNGWYRQGSNTGGVLDDNILKQGYAIASSSLNVFGNNCNDLLAAESMAMVKERFIEAYGPPRYTIGWGCSGGSYQQHQIADNYPGLLDGILPGCSFPDVAFGTVYSIIDQRLLGHYFRDTAPQQFSDEQIEAVAGILSVKTMYTNTVYQGSLRIAADAYCPDALPEDQRYNASSNPTGARCGVYDHTVNVYGKDPATGFARRPIDNVGVQYGLAALNAGTISVDQFLDINEKIGGYDNDANFQAERTVADIEATRQAYRTGRLTSAGGGLRDIPIIDYRAYSDDNDDGDIHLRYHSFSMRERLRKANGDADNQVMLVEDFRYSYYGSRSPLLMSALAQMDQWLANIAADTTAITPNATMHDKVVRNKPATLQDGCNTRDENPTFIAETQSRSSGQCADIYPAPASPRFVAGADIAADVIKCALKPVDMQDYTVQFDTAQSARLQKVFRDGVCDWSKDGVEQQGLQGLWLKF